MTKRLQILMFKNIFCVLISVMGKPTFFTFMFAHNSSLYDDIYVEANHIRYANHVRYVQCEHYLHNYI